MDVNELLLTAARAVAVYVLLLIVIRALGRRTIGNISAFDLLVALMLGEIVDEMIDDFFWAEVSAAEFVVAVGTIVTAHIATATSATASSMRGGLRRARAGA